MANLPELRSREKIIGDLIDGFLARVKDVNDLNRGSVISQFFHAIGQSNFKAAADVISMIDALSVDRAEGEALQRLAADANVTISSGTFSAGRVSIQDISFAKVSTNVFAGQPAPVAGSTKMFVVDASKMNTSGGKIYIGRGTPNVEGPLTFTTVQAEAGGAYWSITLDVASPTTKFHNIGEEIVVSQGQNRKINSGTVVKTPSGSGVSSVNFKTVSPATIADGETKVDDVPVVAEVLGTKGNVPRGAIREAIGLSFSAIVFNDNAFVTGTPPDDETTIRDKIKSAEQAKSKGTEQAIKASAIGVSSTDDLKKVISSSVLRKADSSSALIFDDGSGYEPIFSGIGLEQIIDDALGGERELQLRQRPVAEARVKSIELAPFRIPENYALSVDVQGVTTTHTFVAGDFRVKESATAFETIASINGNPNINFNAATSDSASKIVLYPRDPSKNDITVKRLSSNDANDFLGLQTTTQYTLLLYKNDKILFQDGLPANVTTRLKSAWSTSITEGDTLVFSVDGTPPLEVAFTKEIFQEFDLSATVNAFTDIEIWVKVFNRLMSGVVTTSSGEEIVMTSARGKNNSAAVQIIGGTLKDKIFETGIAIEAFGRESDYTLNRQTGQIGLSVGLSSGDKVTAGSSFTRANITTTQLPDGTSSAGNIWMVVDGGVKYIPSGLEGNTLTTFSKSGSKITIESTNPNLDPVAYDGVSVGDWVVVWPEQTDLANFPSLFSFQGFWRVESVERGKIVVDDGNTVRSVPGTETIPTDRITILQSKAPVQKLSFGVNPLSGFVQEIEDNIEGVTADVIGSTIRISTISAGSNGELTIVAADSEGKAIGIAVNEIESNIPSQKGFVVTEDSEVGMPSFTYSELGSYISDTQFSEPKYDEIGGTTDDFVEILNRYDITSNPEQLRELLDPNKSRRMFVRKYDPTTDILEMQTKEFSKDDSSVLKELDRYFLRTSYQFDSTDTATAIVDGDVTTKIFGLPVARKVTVNNHSSPSLNDFSADDGESSLELKDTSSFSGFNFNDWKAWRQSSALLTDGSTYSVRIKSADYGPAGDTIRSGFVYPTSLDQDSLDLIINNAEMIDVGVVLPVTTARVPNWDGTSSFTTDVTPLSLSRDKVTYQWRVGVEPNFLSGGGGASLVVGDVAIISKSSDFLKENKEIEAKVTDISTNSFSIEIPSGISISDNISIDQSQNIGGLYSITTSTPHLVNQGDRVGVWDTQLIDGVNAPIDGSYFATVVSPNTFTVNLPPSVPGGEILSAIHSANIVVCTSSLPHGLSEGNVIIVGGFSTGNYNGLSIIQSVLSPTQFSYVRDGSSSSVINGRFDYQSYGSGVSISALTLNLVSGVVTVVSSATHGLIQGDIVSIDSSSVVAYNSSVTYAVGDVVSFSGNNYESLVSSNTGNTPNISPSDWSVSSIDLNGIYIVSVVDSTTQFKYSHYHTVGSISSTGGSISNQAPKGRLARSVGDSAAALAFAEVGTTSQEVVDYITENKSDLLQASIELPYDGTEIINTSTKEKNLSPGFHFGIAVSLTTIKASRKITLNVNSFVESGSTVSLKSTNAPQYDGTYSVFSQKQDGAEYKLTLQSNILSPITSTTILVSGTYQGVTDYVALRDGENSINITDLDSSATFPQFQLKKDWSLIPTVGEEIRLVATNTKQLNEFWNRLVVTGISNVAEVENSEYGRQLQITTNQFGSEGSIQFTGGTANNSSVAIVGSGSELAGKVGVFKIPYELRRGLSRKSWVKMEQTVRLNKILGFEGSTTLNVYSTGLEITGGTDGSFQTKRATSHDETSIFKVEKHGKFTAFINIGGQNIGLDVGGVKEGDWVRTTNTSALAYDVLQDYAAGDRVLFAGLNWTAVRVNGVSSTTVNPIPSDIWDIDTDYAQNSTVTYKGKAYIQSSATVTVGQYPDSAASNWNLIWEVREWQGGNTGIYKVVRVFGSDSFWVENDNSIEGMITLGDINNLTFYSHDSVMPNDVLVISGNKLGTANAGRYVVRDETFGSAYLFPTSTRIFTDPIPVATGSVALGDSVNQVNVEEQNPVRIWKRILAVGPAETGLANIIVDSPNLLNRFSSSNAAFIEAQGKIGYDTVPAFGIDAYKSFGGLIKALNRVIYGDPTSPAEFPGTRAAGTDIGIREAIIKRIKVSLGVRVRTGISFSDIRESIKAAVAGYVNNLGVGEQVAMSKILEAASKVGGVASVVITSPDYNVSADQIAVGAQERAQIIDPSFDVTISILGS